jgi:hypothetical protein
MFVIRFDSLPLAVDRGKSEFDNVGMLLDYQSVLYSNVAWLLPDDRLLRRVPWSVQGRRSAVYQ